MEEVSTIDSKRNYLETIIILLNSGEVIACKNFKDYLLFLDERFDTDDQ